ncbi:MAG: D-ribose pyranase [Bacillota bacterium]|nr:D-ribose pyranase [Bacillota bacterium]
MRRDGLLHAELLGLLAALGHGQTIVVADAGLPVPPGVRRIDLAVTPGLPGFLPVLEAVTGAMVVEGATVAEELARGNASLLESVRRLLGPGVRVEAVPHEELKRLSGLAAAVVRTGEFTPYANVLLRAGVAFGPASGGR